MSERNSSGSTVSLEGSTARNLGILVQRLKILSPLDNTPMGFFTPWLQQFCTKSHWLIRLMRRSWASPPCSRRPKVLGLKCWGHCSMCQWCFYYSKKAMHSKLKDLYKKYKTRESCQYLFSPKVNLELWHDLSKESKFKDLGLQELQKGIRDLKILWTRPRRTSTGSEMFNSWN